MRTQLPSSARRLPTRTQLPSSTWRLPTAAHEDGVPCKRLAAARPTQLLTSTIYGQTSLGQYMGEGLAEAVRRRALRGCGGNWP